jgi:dephospho-CoA kinase
MLKIGITGSFGAGKTAVAGMFAAGLGHARVIDADALAHEILRHDAACVRAVVKSFGPDIVSGAGIDRAKLGKVVFNDPSALRKLEGIIHPRLRRKIIEEMKKARGVFILDAAILIEAGWHKMVDVLVVVKARREVQLARAMARTGLSGRDVLKRIRRQMPFSEKRQYADFVIDNSAGAAVTRKHVEGVIRSLQLTPIQQERAS